MWFISIFNYHVITVLHIYYVTFDSSTHRLKKSESKCKNIAKTIIFVQIVKMFFKAKEPGKLEEPDVASEPEVADP